ncbi:MAG: hypothetical protein ACK45S_05910 [Sphingobacteriales bacterium]|jgi:hypothetical protein
MPIINRNQEIFPYIVVLKRKNQQGFWMLSMAISFLFIIYLIWKAIQSPDWIVLTLLIITLNGLLMAHLYSYFKKGKKEMYILYITAFIALFFMPFLLGLILVGIAYLGFLATQPEEIGFNHDRILIKKMFKRTIQWEELSNAMIKDGLLTLDFKNNKLFQAETDDEEDNDEYDASEEEFNEFCKAHLKP